jgi:hypothetical protein
LFELQAAAIAHKANYLSHKVGFPDWRIVVPNGIATRCQESAPNASNPVSHKPAFPPV